MNQRRTRRCGTTIIELVMAIVILSVALPSLVVAFADASTQTIRPSRITVASFLETERMEEIIARRHQGTDGYSAVTVANFPAESPVSGFPAFNRSVTVTYTDAALSPVGGDQGYKRVQVTVTWNSGAEQLVIERVFANF